MIIIPFLINHYTFDKQLQTRSIILLFVLRLKFDFERKTNIPTIQHGVSVAI